MAEREIRVLRQVFGEDVDLDNVDELIRNLPREPMWDFREDGTPYIVEPAPPKSGVGK